MKPSIFVIFFILIHQLTSIYFPSPRRLQTATTTAVSTTPLDPNFTCNQEMMLSYGLTGNTKPVNIAHKYCPGITNNCCTIQDVDTTMYLWTTDSEQRVEIFYEVYLYLVKYILGYSAEVGLLAKDFSTSTNSNCKTAANDFLSMNLNPKMTSIIYGSFADTVTALGSLRKGFYCILCDAMTQQALKEFWAIVNLFYSDRVYFSEAFCQTLVDKTIQTSYFTVTYLKRFAENAATLIACKTGSTSTTTFELALLRSQQVKNCFFFKTKYFFFFCENYCENFDLVKPADLLDNDIAQLSKFFTLIKNNKDKAFYNPSNNILWGGSYEETFIVNNLAYVQGVKVFFPAASKSQVDLSQYKTDVVYTGGMNPWPSVESSLYPMVIAGAAVYQIVGVLAFFALKFIG